MARHYLGSLSYCQPEVRPSHLAGSHRPQRGLWRHQRQLSHPLRVQTDHLNLHSGGSETGPGRRCGGGTKAVTLPAGPPAGSVAAALAQRGHGEGSRRERSECGLEANMSCRGRSHGDFASPHAPPRPLPRQQS
eukprot:1848538-Rhodomonas_salina.1